MSEVRCFYSWNEKKAQKLESWVKGHEERYALFIEDDPSIVVLATPHPRIRFISATGNRHEIFEKIASEFLFLPFTFEDHPKLQPLVAVHSELNIRAFDFTDQGIQLLKNIRQNLLQPTSLAKDLYGKFNTPAIVCGGGPSLTTAAAELKRLQDQAVIIGCGAGVEALLKMGIKPHFAAHVDPATLHKFSAADIPLFYQLRTDSSVVAKYKSLHFLVSGTGNLPLESWIEKKWGLEPIFDGGWTVGTFGVALASCLGCKTIILAGIDLAASSTQLYAPGVKTTSSSNNFIPMKNRNGKDVLSRPDWVLAAKWLNQFALQNSHIQWGTIAQHGLEIPSIPLFNLQDLIGTPWKLDPTFPTISGEAIWNEIKTSFQKSFELCQKILQEMEKIFPQSPNGVCALLEHELSQELAFQQVFEPLWAYWHHPILRYNTAGELGVYLKPDLVFPISL